MTVMLIIALVATVTLAYFESWLDYTSIQDNVEINHRKGWVRRASIMVVILLLTRNHPMAAAALAVSCAFLFSLCFRRFLNLRRGLDVNYVSPSNWYDWQFLRWTLGWINTTNYRQRVREQHAHNYQSLLYPAYRDGVHRAGRWSSGTEILLSALCLMAYAVLW